MALFLRGLCLLAGYLFGGFLTAEVVARCTAGVSARDIGTGNPGMANIATHLGKRPGCWFWRATSSRLRRPAGSATSLRRSWGLPLCCTAGLARCSGTTGRFGTRAGAARA